MPLPVVGRDGVEDLRAECGWKGVAHSSPSIKNVTVFIRDLL